MSNGRPTTYETADEFFEAGVGDMLIIQDSRRDVWLSWETEDGDRFATRARHEDDSEGPDGDRWRPVGPIFVDDLPFPISVIVAHEAFAPGPDYAKAYSDAMWELYPEGGALMSTEYTPTEAEVEQVARALNLTAWEAFDRNMKWSKMTGNDIPDDAMRLIVGPSRTLAFKAISALAPSVARVRAEAKAEALEEAVKEFENNVGADVFAEQSSRNGCRWAHAAESWDHQGPFMDWLRNRAERIEKEARNG